MLKFFKRRKHQRCPIVEPPDFWYGSYPKELPKLEWVESPNGNEDFPEGMVCGGKLETGQMAYIACCHIEKQSLAGFVVKESRVAHFTYGRTEHNSRKYKVLTVENPDSLVWMRCRNGEKPDAPLVPVFTPTDTWPATIVGRTCTDLTDGHTYNNHRLQVSQWALTGNEIHRPGSIHPYSGYFTPYSGQGFFFEEHEMLMMKITPGSLQDICKRHILMHMLLLINGKFRHIDKLPLPVKLKNFLKEPTVDKWVHRNFNWCGTRC